jgi:hypothetical protein
MSSTSHDSDSKAALDAALERLDASRAAEQIKAKQKDELCPPDRELTELFAEFARRMSSRMEVPFVNEKKGQQVERIPTGLFRKEKVETKTIYQHEEVARGWPIPGIGGHFTASLSKLREAEIWFGLAIDTEGGPWFAQEATREHSYWGPLYTSQMLRVDGRLTGLSSSYGRRLGRPRGKDLRDAIREFCSGGIRHDLGLDYLPEVIADAMASVLRKSG